MTAHTVRRAIRADLLGLLQLMSRADEGVRPAVSSATNAEVETWDTMLTTAGLDVYVAELDNRIVGTAMLSTMPNLGYQCRPSGFIEAMVVSAHARRRGIGRDIVQRILADAAGLGCHKIQLLTHKRHADDGAHDFYRSLGFAAEAEGLRLYLS